MNYRKTPLPPAPFSPKASLSRSLAGRKRWVLPSFAVRNVLACLVLVFFVLAGDAKAQLPTCPYTLPTSPTDRDILILLYCATDGDNWTDNTGWGNSTLSDTWHGVKLDASNRVSELELSNNNLTGSIPAELGNLSNLERLYLDQNQLTGTILSQLGNLSSLRVLRLRQNQLTGAIPSELGNLSSLRVLHLSQNQLTGAIPSELGNLSSLRQLYLNRNQLTGTIPAQLGSLSNLERLYLDRNQLTGTIPTELESLTSLEWLYLWGNELTGAIPSELGNLSNLERLYLSRNQLTGAIPTQLGSLTSLRQLYLNRNQLTGTIPAQLGSLTSLRQLYLNRNQLTGTIPAQLGSLTSLEWLYLWGNELTGAIPSELGNLSSLQLLYLNQNQLTGAIPSELENLSNLLELAFWGNEDLAYGISDELGKRVDRAVLRTLSNVNSAGDNTWFPSEELPQDRFSFSSWSGVSTDATTDRISELDLSNNGLMGNLTNAIEVLGGLENLNISNNRELTGELPLRLTELSIETLNIRCTDVSVPSDGDFQTWLSGITSFRRVCTPPPPPPPGDGGGGCTIAAYYERKGTLIPSEKGH